MPKIADKNLIYTCEFCRTSEEFGLGPTKRPGWLVVLVNADLRDSCFSDYCADCVRDRICTPTQNEGVVL